MQNGIDARAIYDTLDAAYGDQHWWPGETPLEIAIGAVLTQNTAWHNVSLAIDRLKADDLLDLHLLLAAEPDRVRTAIAPSGFYNVKYERLTNLLTYLVAQEEPLEALGERPLDELRPELLAVRGVGPETADSILLYALEQPTFVVDAYTRRIFSRLGAGWMAGAPYAEIRKWFMAHLPEDVALYNQYHALIVRHAKEACRKRPDCAACVPAGVCAWRESAEANA